MTSFRQQMGGSKSRQKRGALADFYENNPQLNSPEKSADPEHNSSSPRSLSKKLSLGRNLVGSIRSMATKHTRSPPGKNQKENVIPANIPLPPSPIPPPALTVDIGGGEALVPDGFPKVVSTNEGSSTAKQPSNTTLSQRENSLDLLTVDKSGDFVHRRTSTPVLEIDDQRQLNETPPEDVEELKVFERGVAIMSYRPPRRMVSLDAMAERCTQSPNDHSPNALLQSKAPLTHSPLQSSPAATVLSYQSDMEEISRQPAHTPMPTVLLEGQGDRQWRSDDPFAPGTPSIKLHGPDTELPFRPRSVLQKPEEDNGAAMEDLSSIDGHVFTSHSAAINSSSPDQKALTSAKKHRSMVSEVLEIDHEEIPADDFESPGFDNLPDEMKPDHLPRADRNDVYGRWGQANLERVVPAFRYPDDTEETDSESISNIAVTHSPVRINDTEISRVPTPANSERTDGPEGGLHSAILDNYDLQVALGGVDITCDDKLRAWLDESEEAQEQDRNALRSSTGMSYDCDVLIDNVGSEMSESINASSVLEMRSRSKEDSLDEALDMYRSYSAEHDAEMVEDLLKAVDIPTSPASASSLISVASPTNMANPTSADWNSSAKRKPVPTRYRSVRGRKV